MSGFACLSELFVKSEELGVCVSGETREIAYANGILGSTFILDLSMDSGAASLRLTLPKNGQRIQQREWSGCLRDRGSRGGIDR